MKRTIRFTGITKDGKYTAEKELDISPDEAYDMFTIPKIITENGWINAHIVLDNDGRLIELQLERWDPTVV